MRRFAVSLIVVVMVFLEVGNAAAHHGGTGDYDAGNPVYLTGTVTQASYGSPHALLTIRVSEGADVPKELEGAEELNGYEYWQQPPQLTGAGQEQELLLPPDLTAEVGALANRPEIGDEVSAIAYRRCGTGEYEGELRVQMLYASGSRFAYGGTVTRIVPQCESENSGNDSSQSENSENDSSQAESSDQASGTSGSSDNGLLSTVLVVGSVLIVVAVGFAVVRGIIRLRSRGGD